MKNNNRFVIFVTVAILKLLIIHAQPNRTTITFEPCKFANCGEGYDCIRNLSKPYGYECIEKVNNSRRVNLTEAYSSCLVNPCKNGGICRLNKALKVPLCICKTPFVGSTCEINSNESNSVKTSIFNDSPSISLNIPTGQFNYPPSIPHQFNPAPLGQKQTYFFNQQFPINQFNSNPCETYQLLGVNVCQNGGYCISSTPGRVSCVCPITHVGEFCEKELYTQCPTIYSLCDRNNGKCVNGNFCICRAGYHGKKCDEQDKCKPSYCLNNGTCEQISTEPFRKCTCQTGYTGSRCESFGSSSSSVISSGKSSCNYTVSLLNEGVYISRLRVSYTFEGKRQKAATTKTLKFIGEHDSVTIPAQSTDVIVKLEAFNGLFWDTIHDDAYLGLDKECIKCYKVWGTIAFTEWDYIFC